MQALSPSSIVKLNSNIQALFDREEWYDGKVTKICGYGHDFSGKYVICHITYEDGDVDEDVRLYDNFFETTEEDAWRFKNEFSKIICMYNDIVREIENIKSDVDDIMDNVADLIEEDSESTSPSNDAKDDSAYESEEEDNRNNQGHTGALSWYMIGNIIGIVLGFGASYTMKCYDFNDIPKWI